MVRYSDGSPIQHRGQKTVTLLAEGGLILIVKFNALDIKQVLSFIKIEHTLFSLPFVLLGYMIAVRQFGVGTSMDLLWILLAAVGARGLAMALNRIIDRDIDAANPRTQGRHLASGAMSLRTAWMLAAVFLAMLLISAGLLNEVALMMAWLPVLTFVVYPYTKRFTWGCHFWLGLCLGLQRCGRPGG